MMFKDGWILTILALMVSSTGGAPTPPDPNRYIPIDEIHTGMKGYGLTVFHGTCPERFDVEVVSVMRNYQPHQNAILVRCLDKRFDVARGVQGCSGSPVFFNDRMAGAMAFGWSFSAEPLYGVTPIAEMLDVRRAAQSATGGSTPQRRGLTLDRTFYQRLMSREMLTGAQLREIVIRSGLVASRRKLDAGLESLPALMILGGFQPSLLTDMESALGSLDLQIAPASMPSGDINEENACTGLVPGGTVTIPLITGDMNGAVLGTVTEVVGDQVYAFGHAWNGDGPVNWPMAAGYIHTFVSRQNISFKLGQAREIVGALQADEAAAVFGTINAPVTMIPVQATVNWKYRNTQESFSMRIAQDEKADPILAAMVGANVLMQKGDLPRHHTLRYKIRMTFDSVAPLEYEAVSSDAGPMAVVGDILVPLSLLLGNPWKPVKLTGLDLTAEIEDKDCLAAIFDARMEKRLYRPGETVRVVLTLEPLRQERRQVELSLVLPDDLPAGTYRIQVGSANTLRMQMAQSAPYLYDNPLTIEDLHRIIQDRFLAHEDRLYMVAQVGHAGVSLDNEPLPYLPGSRTMLLNDVSRKNKTGTFSKFIYSELPTPFMVMGDESFQIQVRRDPMDSSGR